MNYKVYKDFTNYVSIDETELEKALKAFQRGAGVIFNNGAMSRVEAILPDDVKMMGWNDGYKPTGEEQGEISHNKTCLAARRLMSEMKDHLALGTGEPFKLIETSVRKYTNGPTSLGELLNHD